VVESEQAYSLYVKEIKMKMLYRMKKTPYSRNTPPSLRNFLCNGKYKEGGLKLQCNAVSSKNIKQESKKEMNMHKRGCKQTLRAAM